MALWFLRGLRRGVVTTSYPRRPDQSWTALPSPPVFYSERLSPEVVELLVAVCPSRALAADSTALVLDVARCTACWRCLRAVDQVGAPSCHWEWATRDPGRLRQRFLRKEMT